jgi:hypothetical protein
MPCPHPGGPAVHLEALRRELAGRGWITSLLEPAGRPSSLFVQNPDRGPSAQSHWPLPPTFHAGRSPEPDKSPLRAHVPRGMSVLTMIDTRKFVGRYGLRWLCGLWEERGQGDGCAWPLLAADPAPA